MESKLGRHKKSIKECLPDQSVVAGIGNIYSDEILFRAKVRPSRPANSLNGCEWERLSAVIPECMAYFIEKNTITPEEYLETKGQDYRNTPFLQVYGHDSEAGPVCGEILCVLSSAVGAASIAQDARGVSNSRKRDLRDILLAAYV